MGILSKLLGHNPAPSRWVEIPGDGHFEADIVGESHYQDTLNAICRGKTADGHEWAVTAALIYEDDNPYDDKAIRVAIGGMTVGYLSRENARDYRRQMFRQGCGGFSARCGALIVGGWDRGGGDTGNYGVKLDLPVE